MDSCLAVYRSSHHDSASTGLGMERSRYQCAISIRPNRIRSHRVGASTKYEPQVPRLLTCLDGSRPTFHRCDRLRCR